MTSVTLVLSEAGKTFHLHANFFTASGENAGSTQIVVDTGSGPIVIGSNILQDSFRPVNENIKTPGYSSSGNSYKGSWVLVDRLVLSSGGSHQSEKGPSVTIANLIVFRTDSHPTACMMGMGIRQSGKSDTIEGFSQYYTQMSVLLNIVSPPLECHGYIIKKRDSQYTITFGYSAADSQEFDRLPLNGDAYVNPTATFTFSKNGKSLYSEQVPFLFDTGIPEIIWTPGADFSNPPPPKDHHELEKGDQIDIKVGSVDWTVTSVGTSGNPEFLRIAHQHSTSKGIVNTGRYFLEIADYALQVTQKEPVVDGWIGVRKH